MKKPLILAALITTVIGFSIYGVEAVRAQEGTLQTTFVEQLAQKLGLSEEKVQTAVDEVRDERKEAMKANLEERLDEAVGNGVLTESQKTALLVKLEEKHARREKMREELEGLTPEERREKMRAYKGEDTLRDWAEKEGINLTTLREYIYPYGYGMKHGGGMMSRGW